MKIPLADQIEVTTTLRDAWEGLAEADARLPGGPDPRRTAEVLNGVVLTLSLIQATETDFRQFMAQRSTNTTKGA